MNAPTVIIGGGLAGLACAITLTAAGREVIVLESSDDVGGRARTDALHTPEGRYLLDRGFQVLLTAYPEARRMLDFSALKLQNFYSGADVWCEGAMHRIANPFRHPIEAIKSFQSPVTTLADKAVLAKMYASSSLSTLESMRTHAETSTIDRLRAQGLSDRAIDRFFRPFFGGVFFDRELQTSSRMFDFVFKMFAAGDAAVPAEGMGQIARQLAARLPGGAIMLNTTATSLHPTANGVEIQVNQASGSSHTIHADICVIATESDAAIELLLAMSPPINRRWVATATLWYAHAGPPPTDAPILMLNGESIDEHSPAAPNPAGSGPVNHLAILSNAAPTYAPSGHTLIAANIIGVPHSQDFEADVDRRVRDQLRHWFGENVATWQLLRVQPIRRALPDIRVGVPDHEAVPPSDPSPRITDRLLMCGDHRTSGSIDAALRSGRLAAEALLAR